ncbi:MAG: MarR family transcriptional regulator [Armatimonadota bacterium]
MSKPAELESHLGYQVRRASNHISSRFARKLGEEGVSVAEWVVLRHLHGGPMSPSSLAVALSVTQGAISKVLDKLLTKGYVASQISATDRRAQQIELTSEGTNVVPLLAALADENDSFFFDGLSKDEQARLRSLLLRLNQIHGWNDVPTQ